MGNNKEDKRFVQYKRLIVDVLLANKSGDDKVNKELMALSEKLSQLRFNTLIKNNTIIFGDMTVKRDKLFYAEIVFNANKTQVIKSVLVNKLDGNIARVRYENNKLEHDLLERLPNNVLGIVEELIGR